MPEKTCPPHEWNVIATFSDRVEADCNNCDVILNSEEIKCRLSACEALSAEDAEIIAANTWQEDYAQIAGEWRDPESEKRYNALLEYARILGGDDGTE